MTDTLDLLDRLKNEMPEIWGQAQVVGKWVWLEFNIPPLKEIRANLRKLGFHWNGGRKGWQHPGAVFRRAIIAAAAAVVIMHNHPSGEPQPSEADIKVTRDLIRAGQLLKIEVLDHVIMGRPNHCSLRELGYFYS